jgi:hypothetical protein
LIGCVVLIVLASCAHEYCPTYSGSTKRNSKMTVSAKKVKNLNKTPYYKTLKRAEQD